ncbi:homoserine dehydrogenase [Qipengyuania sp. DSG2-2]|uniref:homoserine dehydrogenase n=1 Tax=Qipengyuania sp. DGS2-2 TaxID=3349631 RepID=UPI0036D4007C
MSENESETSARPSGPAGLTSQKPLRLGIAGLGTVGVGVIRLLAENRDLIEARSGRPIEVVAVTAQTRAKDRGIDLAPFAWAETMDDLAQRGDVDVVVELVGGSGGSTLALAQAALQAGKGVVTANKAMIAHHGHALATAAESSGAPLRFEAAVAGGIPIISGLREGASGNALKRVYGILNGTSNYILSQMESSGADFAETLGDAQALGYAEADPAFDIDGVDAAHKLAILSALSFGTQVDFDGVEIEGIRQVRAVDIARADALGFVVRLIGVADIENQPGGVPRLLQRVRPCLIAKDHPLAPIDGATNAVVAEGNFSGQLLFQGAGAGEGPTASAVVADIIAIARGDRTPPFSIPTGSLRPATRADSGARVSRSYLRFTVADKPGVLAELAAAMRDADVSIESLIQDGSPGQDGVLIAMVTHPGPVANVRKAVAAAKQSPSLTGAPLVMPILQN